MDHWTSKIEKTPAIATRKFQNGDLENYAEAAGYYKLGQWLQEVRDTLLKTSQELNESKVAELLGLEGGLLHAVVKHKTDMRSEKFYHKVSQVARCVSRYLQCRPATLLCDVAQLWPEAKSLHHATHVRLPSPPLLHHALLLMARGYVILQHTRELCEEAAVWLQAKISTGQRVGLALALFSIVSRVRAVSLYLLQSLSTGYDKLCCLLCGLPLPSSSSQPQALHLSGNVHELDGARKTENNAVKLRTKQTKLKGSKEDVMSTDYESAAKGTVLQGLPRRLYPRLLQSHNNMELELHNDGAEDDFTVTPVGARVTDAEDTDASEATASDEADLGEVIERPSASKRKRSDSKPSFKNKKPKTKNSDISSLKPLDGLPLKKRKKVKKATSFTALTPLDEKEELRNMNISSVVVPVSSKLKKKQNKKLAKAASLKEFDVRGKFSDDVSLLPSGLSSKKKEQKMDTKSLKESFIAKSRSKLWKSSSVIMKNCSPLQLSSVNGNEDFASKSSSKLKKKKSFTLLK